MIFSPRPVSDEEGCSGQECEMQVGGGVQAGRWEGLQNSL